MSNWRNKITLKPWSGEPLVINGRVTIKANFTDSDFAKDGRYEIYLTAEEKTFLAVVETSWLILQAIKEEVGEKASIAEFLNVARYNGEANATTASILAWCTEKGISYSDNMQSLMSMNTDATNNKRTWYDLIDALQEKVIESEGMQA